MLPVISPAIAVATSSLPLPPVLTPAIGITGAVLMITGIIYCLIGIKHKALYVFLAPAFLVSLAVVVLIEYVDSPPVRNAVQGAYFVAAFVAGCIFGALSLIFTEVTEGLGCLLGGFCLSMWFLVLKPGGLLTTTTSRAIFIGVFSVVGFSVSFSQYTRTYGLIFSIAFAGATITILGVDCFSRAGLKEFWLYIWNLNSQLFPLNTNTYPITRGIKVEIAGIIILFLLGIISQLKVWKLVKERREKKAAANLQHDQEREDYEAHLGKQIEQHNAKARKQWERIYGDKMSGKHEPADSGVGSSRDSFNKTSLSVKEYRRSRQNSIELSDVPDSIYASSAELAAKGNAKDGNSRVSVRALSDDEIQLIDAHGNPMHTPRPPAIQEEAIGYVDSTVSSDFQRSSASLKGKSLRPSVAPPPVVIPLPFEVPPSDESSDEDPASAIEKGQRRKPRDKRLSRLSMANRLSTAASLGDELEVPHIEDDRRSSLAATLNDKLDLDESLPKLSPSLSAFKTDLEEDRLNTPEVIGETKSERAVRVDASGDLKPMECLPRSKSDTDLAEKKVEARTAEKQGEAKATQESPQVPPVDPAVMQAASATLTSSTRPKEESSNSDGRDVSTTQEPIAAGGVASLMGALTRQLPDKLSRIALSYRTNEWAKHLDAAEEPQDEMESRPSTPGVTVEVRSPEPAAPSKAVERQEKPKEVKRPVNVARNSSTSSYRTAKATPIYASQASSSTSLDRNNSTHNVYNVNAIQRNASQSSVRNSSAPSRQGSQSKPSTAGHRSSSMPLSTQPLVESAVEEEPADIPTTAFTRMNSSRGTLLHIAEKKHQDRTSSALLNRQSSSPNVTGLTSSNSSSSNENPAPVTPVVEDDDMPLAQRRSIIQAQRQSSHHASPPQPALFNSHQPQRSSTVDSRKQAAHLALWRDSMRSDLASKAPRVAEEEEARTQMMVQRKNSQMRQEQQAAAQQHRESAFDNMMRRGDMLDLHREKMRRMQANANKHAG
ncbi:MAG: hypothetical protein Q9165_004092 [Trypethelium subeluteriae]